MRLVTDAQIAGLQALFPNHTIDITEGATGVIRIALKRKEQDERIFRNGPAEPS